MNAEALCLAKSLRLKKLIASIPNEPRNINGLRETGRVTIYRQLIIFTYFTEYVGHERNHFVCGATKVLKISILLIAISILVARVYVYAIYKRPPL